MGKLIENLHSIDLLKLLNKNKGDRLKKAASFVLVILVIAAAFVYRAVSSNETDLPELREQRIEAATGTIFVDIGGAVREPMLAELPEGSRVEDAINAAGGLKDDADLTSINRADFLEDGEKIYIPEFPEPGENSTVGEDYSSLSTGQNSTGKVNINTADSQQLQTLNGVGPSTAQKIIDYRNSSGRFNRTEDIMNVSGIGEKTFEKLKDNITV